MLRQRHECERASVGSLDITLTCFLQSNSASATLLLGLLGIVLDDITGLIGLNCSPITVVGVGSGNACSANAVCCTNNNVVSAYR